MMSHDYVELMPKRQRVGKVLCHNHVMHDKDTMPNVNGFRAWWTRKAPDNFVPCPCGWTGLPHYAWDAHVAHYKEAV